MTRFPNADAWRKACAAGCGPGHLGGAVGHLFRGHFEKPHDDLQFPRHTGGGSGIGGTGGTGAKDNNAGPPGNGGASADQVSILLGHVSAAASSRPQGRRRRMLWMVIPIHSGTQEAAPSLDRTRPETNRDALQRAVPVPDANEGVGCGGLGKTR
jgi:hypothetical protein